jgi:hypothetical protein
MCNENILLGAPDRMLTAGDVEFEPTTAKIYEVTNPNVVMIAGESSLQLEILQEPPVSNTSPDGPQDQIESKPAIEAEVMASGAAEGEQQ